MTSKQSILNRLTQQPQSSSQLSKNLKLSPHGIRGRISELRHDGYNIKNISGTYHLIQPDSSPSIQIINYITTNNLFDTELNYTKLSHSLKLPTASIIDGISKLFSNYHIIQLSQNSCIIFKS